jgi:hypothetical protein
MVSVMTGMTCVQSYAVGQPATWTRRRPSALYCAPGFYPTGPFMLQRDLQQTLHARARATTAEIEPLARPLDPEQMNRRPAEGGWSVALAARIDASAQFDWRVLTLSSPIVPRVLKPLARLNLDDVFGTHVVHAERHARQIERAIATLS